MRSLGCALAVVALVAACATGDDERSEPMATSTATAAAEPAAGD
jgi:hypothetical protein